MYTSGLLPRTCDRVLWRLSARVTDVPSTRVGVVVQVNWSSRATNARGSDMSARGVTLSTPAREAVATPTAPCIEEDPCLRDSNAPTTSQEWTPRVALEESNSLYGPVEEPGTIRLPVCDMYYYHPCSNYAYVVNDFCTKIGVRLHRLWCPNHAAQYQFAYLLPLKWDRYLPIVIATPGDEVWVGMECAWVYLATP